MNAFDQKLGKGLVATLAFFILCLPTFSAAPLFARFSTDRATIYAGEAFQIILAIHITGDMLAPQISIDGLPAPAQLQLYPFQELPIENVTLDDRPYEVRKFRAWARAPYSGSVLLSPQLSGTFIQTTRSFFMMQESRRTIAIPVEATTLTIAPLPEAARPADFSGLVGRFSFFASSTSLNIALGDLITVTFTIGGDLLPATYLKPSIKPAPDLKVYELKPLAGESIPNRQVFTQTLVPVSTNLTTIPACSLSFFDTDLMRYRTLAVGPFPIRYHAEHAPVQTIYSPTQTTAKASITNASEGVSAFEKSTFWERLKQHLKPERFVSISGKEDVQVYLAPSELSKPLFKLKPGTSVDTGTTNENWVYISSSDGAGWLPSASISP